MHFLFNPNNIFLFSYTPNIHGLFQLGVLQPVSEVEYSQVSSGVTYSRVQRTDVDQDFLLLFSVVNENLSWYLYENIQTFCLEPADVNPSDPDFQLSNQMNGKCFFAHLSLGSFPERHI